MADLYGVYDPPHAAEPKRIRIEGTQQDMEQLQAVRPPESYIVGPKHVYEVPSGRLIHQDEHWQFGATADKELIHTIAKRIEISCDDQRLIDWMQQP